MSVSCNCKQQHPLLLLIAQMLSTITVIIIPAALMLSVVPSSAASAEPARTTLHPHCQAKCGNVSIPYPFGIGRGCYREGFQVRCNSSYNPPRLFMMGNGSDIEMTGIWLERGKVRVYNHIGWVCYNKTTRVGEDLRGLDLSAPYTFSSDENKFVVVGCRDFAAIEGTIRSLIYDGGCLTACDDMESVISDSCGGMGCCDTSIPEGLTGFTIIFVDNVFETPKQNISDFNPCGYAFLVQRSEYKFNMDHIRPGTLNTTTYKNGAAPVLLDWVIANKTCEQARLNSTSFACVDKNSKCLDSDDASGYLCHCSKGYHGNPYLPDGCQDINECELPETQCYGNCTNTPGSFICSCHSGRGNPHVVDGCIHRDATSETIKALIGTMVAFFVVFIGFLVYFGVKRRKLMKVREKFFEQNGGRILQQQLNTHHANSFSFILFTLKELEKATKKFDNSLIIGRGGHGTVYKGILEDKRVVAIKKSRLLDDNQTKEFAKEMLILSQINHKNVIKLLGCCLEVEVPMLVYEFVPNGNLYQYLHVDVEKLKLTTCSLDTRLRIAQESADALAYLHSSAYPPIIHGDVKSSNILLDEQFVAKVSDFGASKFVPKDEAELATVVQGTCGYLDPEYLITCQLTEKSDVYSFGVVILELLVGKKPLEFDASGEERNLASICVSAIKENKFAQLLDMDDQALDEEDIIIVNEVAKIALRCLKFSGVDRPTMMEVAEDLRMLRRSKISKHKYGEVHIKDLEESSDDETKNTAGESLYGYDTTRSYIAEDQVTS